MRWKVRGSLIMITSDSEWLIGAAFGLPDGVLLTDNFKAPPQTYWRESLDVSKTNYYCISRFKLGKTQRIEENVDRVCVFPLDDVGTAPGCKIDPAEITVAPSYIIETSPGNFHYGWFL